MIHIVTDSTCDIPPSLLEQHHITSIPVYVNIGPDSYLDGIELSREEFNRGMAAGEKVTTAAPSTGTFVETYQKLADEGATEILSLHIAHNLSNTASIAEVAAKEASIPVTVVDSEQVSVGAGFLVLAASEAAQAGKPLAEIVAMVNEMKKHTRIFGMLDNLEALRRGGRVSWAQFGFGTLLQIKPILLAYGGEITVAARVRTKRRALPQLVNMVAGQAPLQRLAILHVNAPDTVAQLYEQVKPYFPEGEEPMTIEITPAVASHFGLGAVGVACVSKV